MLPICILFDVQYSGCYIKSLSGHLFKQINPFFFTPMFYMLLPLIIFLLHLNFPDTIRDIPYTVVFFNLSICISHENVCFFFRFCFGALVDYATKKSYLYVFC